MQLLTRAVGMRERLWGYVTHLLFTLFKTRSLILLFAGYFSYKHDGRSGVICNMLLGDTGLWGLELKAILNNSNYYQSMSHYV